MKKRKEIIVVDGVTILFMLIVVCNAVLVGFVLKYHNGVVFQTNKTQQQSYGALLGEVRELKNEITALEGAPNWDSTKSAKKFEGENPDNSSKNRLP